MKKIISFLAAAAAALSLTFTGLSAAAAPAEYSGYAEQSAFGAETPEDFSSTVVIDGQGVSGQPLVSSAATETDIDEENSSDGIVKKILISLAIGVIVALIVCMIMKSMMKTARPKATANDYIRKNSFNITRSRDIFVYANVTKKKREKEDNK
ncbi:MAG: hypothetical protein ACI4WS_14410 [Oscillospiraceae bacterium]